MVSWFKDCKGAAVFRALLRVAERRIILDLPRLFYILGLRGRLRGRPYCVIVKWYDYRTGNI